MGFGCLFFAYVFVQTFLLGYGGSTDQPMRLLILKAVLAALLLFWQPLQVPFIFCKCMKCNTNFVFVFALACDMAFLGLFLTDVAGCAPYPTLIVAFMMTMGCVSVGLPNIFIIIDVIFNCCLLSRKKRREEVVAQGQSDDKTFEKSPAQIRV